MGFRTLRLRYTKTGAAIGQPMGKAFQIFDKKLDDLLKSHYSTGMPITDDTLDDLAKKLDLNSSEFKDTVETYNAATRSGNFDPLILNGLSTQPSLPIPKSNLALPINEPPTKAQILNNEGLPMRCLWAAG